MVGFSGFCEADALPQGVTVAAYRSDRWPAFLAADSGCAAPLRLDSPEEAAALVRANLLLRLDSGTLIGARPRTWDFSGV